MTATSEALKQVFVAARPLVSDWLDIAEQIAALRETATNAGLDWSQIKALLKAQIQDERDENGDGKRVKRLLEKADHATAYADMLGLSNMNEKNFSVPAHDPETGEIRDIESMPAFLQGAGLDAAGDHVATDAPAARIHEQESGILPTGGGEPLTDETGIAGLDSSHDIPVKMPGLTGPIPEIPPPDVLPEPVAGQVAETLPPVDVSATVSSDDLEIPAFLRRVKPGGAPEVNQTGCSGPMGASPEPHEVAA